MRGLFLAATVAVLLSAGALAGDFAGTASARGAVMPDSVPFGSGYDWTNMSPSGGPAGTIVNMAMVYDSSADRMVVFGGTDFQGHGSDTTWAYDFESNTWTDRNPETHPHAGWLDRAAYDSWAHRMIMFGGYDSVTRRFTNETWAYDYAGNNWTNLSPSGAPSPRTRPGLAFDSQSDRVVLFGGDTSGTGYSNETFSYDYDTNTWTNMSPAVHPGARRSSMMAYDPIADRMVLFGGTDDMLGGDFHGAYNDTWSYDFDTNTWTDMNPPAAPSPRYHGGFAYDSQVDRFVLYGGIGDDNSLYETWLYAYDNNTWNLIAPDHSPPPKALMGMAFDTQSARTIMFGGNAGGNTPGNETWAFTAENPPQDSETDWTNMNPSDAPDHAPERNPARSGRLRQRGPADDPVRRLAWQLERDRWHVDERDMGVRFLGERVDEPRACRVSVRPVEAGYGVRRPVEPHDHLRRPHDRGPVQRRHVVL